MSAPFPERIAQLPSFDGHFTARELNAEGCRVLFASYTAGEQVPAHDHDTDNHGLVTAGELLLTLDGVEQCVPAGSWYQVPKFAEHAARFEQDTAMIEFWFEEEGA